MLQKVTKAPKGNFDGITAQFLGRFLFHKVVIR